MNNDIIKILQQNFRETQYLLKTSLEDYIKVIHYLLFRQDYIFKDFHLKIIEYLERYIFDRKNTKNLIINMPVRCGKSLLVCYFISWVLSINKRNNIIYTSYDSSLTMKYSTMIRDYITTDFYKTIFNQSISPDTKAKDEWKIIDGGEFIAKSIASGLTGRGAEFIVIDDPMKASESRSKVELQNVIDIYNNTIKSRLDNKDTGRIILIMQRLCKGDLSDYLLTEEKDNWDCLKFSAINENNESIFEERLPLEFLLREKRINNYNFMAQYQQEPIALGGNIIKTEWFNNYTILPKLKTVYITADTAFTTKSSGDYSVFQLWGKDNMGANSNYYLIDMIRGKWEAPELLNNLLNFYTKWKTKYLINCLYIENKASGIGLIQQIKRLRIPIKEINPTKDKYTRLSDILPIIESGYVYLPEIADWKSDFICECEDFKADMTHKHDDQIDSMSYALSEEINHNNSWNYVY